MFPIRHLPFAVFLPALACAGDAFAWRQLPPLPDPVGVAAPFAGVSNGALVVAGGANFPGKLPWEGGVKTWHDRVSILENPGANWREAGKLPHPLAYGVSATTRAGIVCAGGSDATRHYAETIRLSWSAGALAIEPLPALPVALANAAGALVGETLIVACGAEQPGEQSASNRGFALDLAKKTSAWHELPALPAPPRVLAAAASHGGAFYLFGGVALEPNADGKIARRYLRDAWSFRADQGWKRLAELPKPLAAAPSPAPVIDGRIVLLAGDDGSRAGFQPPEKHPGFPGAILSYDPTLDRWSEAGETPAPRATVPCVGWRGELIIPSGEVRPGVRSPEIWSVRGGRDE
jgi:N-acetylneuraminic acid mutarotase